MFSRPLTADLVIFWRRFRFAVAIDERIRHCCVLVASIMASCQITLLFYVS